MRKRAQGANKNRGGGAGVEPARAIERRYPVRELAVPFVQPVTSTGAGDDAARECAIECASAFAPAAVIS